MTSAETLEFLQNFYKETLQLVLARQASARSVQAYDANNAYQQILGRQDVHLRWLSDAVDSLGGSVGDAPSGEGRDSQAKPDFRQIVEADATAQRDFVKRWQGKVATMTNARHRKMLELVLGEMNEHLRVFQQALEGRTDLLGRHADGKVLSGHVLPARPLQ